MCEDLWECLSVGGEERVKRKIEMGLEWKAT